MKKIIIHVQDFYPEFLNQLNQENNFDHLTYNEIQKKILKKRYAWSDIFQYNIKSYNFFFIFPNFKKLQHKWTVENKIKTNEDTKIFLEQIKYYKPDLVFFQNSITLSKVINKVNFKYILWDGTNSKNLKIAKNAELVLTNMPEAKRFYNLNKINSELFDHFFDRRLLKEIKNFKKEFDITFIGTLSNKDHFDRSIFLGKLNNRFKINFFLGETNSFIRIMIVAFYNLCFKKKTILDFVKYIFFQLKINNLNKGPAFGVRMYEIIKKSKIVLNFHINSGTGLNMRVFECTGIGSCLVSDYQDNLTKYFNCKDDITCFSNIEDATMKINYLLKENEYREKLASNAQKKILLNSTFEKRENQIKKIFDKIVL